MAKPILDMIAPPGALPLAFGETDARLSSRKDAFLDAATDSPVFGQVLRDTLGNIHGVQRLTVTLAGKYRPPGTGTGAPLQSWSNVVELIGPVDDRELARVIHAGSRAFVEGFKSPARKIGNTPPETYLTRITLTLGTRSPQGDLFAPGPGRRGPPVGPWTLEGYSDASTGQRVSKSTWRRSRAAHRAWAKRKGLKRARRGRYKQVRKRVSP